MTKPEISGMRVTAVAWKAERVQVNWYKSGALLKNLVSLRFWFEPNEGPCALTEDYCLVDLLDSSQSSPREVVGLTTDKRKEKIN